MMPDYKVTTPDGRTFKITAPEGATQEQALEYAKANAPKPDLKEGWMDKAYRFMGAMAGGEDPHLAAGEPVAKKGEHPTVEGPQDTALSMLASAPLLAAGGMAASAAVPAGAPALVSTLAAPAGRVVAQGAVSKAKGEDWPQTFVDMTGAILGEGVGATVGKLAGKVAAPATRAAAREVEAARVGKAGGAIFPELDAENDKGLWGAAQQWGKKQVERVFQPAVNEIEAKLGGARTLMLPSVGDKPVSLRTAVKAMFDAEKDTRRLIRGELETALGRVNPTLAQDFAAAMEARGASYAYLGAIKKGFDQSGKYDPARVAKYVNANAEKLQNFSGRYWPKIEEALLGAGKQAPVEIPAKPAATKILGHTLEAPPWAQRLGGRVAEATDSTALRAMIDAALGTPPFGAVAIGAAASAPRAVLRHVPGGKYLDDLIAEEADDSSGH